MADKPHPFEAPVGFGKLVGYRLTAWDHEHAELELHLEARHLNRSNVPHGGVITTLLDTVCGYAGTYSVDPGRIRRAVTLTLTTSFLGQADAGTIVTARARRTGGGQTVFFARGELLDSEGRLIATAEGTFKYLRASEHSKHPAAE